MKKKPIKKIIIAKSPKIRPFDLTLKRAGESARVIEALTSLKFNAGWIFLVQTLQANIKVLEQQIITRIGEDGKTLSEADLDRQRDKHAYLKELIDKPDKFISGLLREDEPDDGLDPYDKEQAKQG